jgi:hypothetical protein
MFSVELLISSKYVVALSGILGQHNTNRIISFCVMLTKVTKGSRGDIIVVQNHRCFCLKTLLIKYRLDLMFSRRNSNLKGKD